MMTKLNAQVSDLSRATFGREVVGKRFGDERRHAEFIRLPKLSLGRIGKVDQSERATG